MGNCCHCNPFGINRARVSPNDTGKITLLLVGLDNAGKSSAAKSLVGDCVDDVVPTVGFSVISLVHCGYSVMIYDLGGGPQIRDIWQRYFTDVHGVIFVIDSSDTARIEEGKTVLTNLLSHEKVSGKPVLVLANKQDQEGALDELDIVEQFDLDALVNRNKCPTLVEMCTANMGKKNQLDPAIHKGYTWLMRNIIDDYSQLNARVVADMARQKELDDAERQERRERVKKMRAERGENGAVELQDVQEEIVGDPFRPVGQVISASRPVNPHSEVRVTLVRSAGDAEPHEHKKNGISELRPNDHNQRSNISLHESPMSGNSSPLVGQNTEASLELKLNRSMSDNSNASDRIILVKESPLKINSVDGNRIVESGGESAGSSHRDVRVRSGGKDPVSRLKSEERLVDRELLDRRRGSHTGSEVILVKELPQAAVGVEEGPHSAESARTEGPALEEKPLFSGGRDPFLVPAESVGIEKINNVNPSITEFVKDQLKMEQKRRPLLRSNKTAPESRPPSRPGSQENEPSLPSARSLNAPLSPLKKATLLPPLKPLNHSMEGSWTRPPRLPNPDVSWAIVTSGEAKVKKANSHDLKDELENIVKG